MSDGPGRVLWTPPADVLQTSRMGKFAGWLDANRGMRFDGYGELWRWSVDDLEGFWSTVVDRFRQIEPQVLLAGDGYRYGDRVISRSAEVAAIRAALPTLPSTVVVPYLDPAVAAPEGALLWGELLAERSPVDFAAVPFDHP